jgi:hypothetical protein
MTTNETHIDNSTLKTFTLETFIQNILANDNTIFNFFYFIILSTIILVIIYFFYKFFTNKEKHVKFKDIPEYYYY